MRRIRISVPDDLKHHRGQWGENGVNWGEARLTINLKDGKVVSRACSHAKGWPEQPAAWEDLCAKFEECSAMILAKSQIDDAACVSIAVTAQTYPNRPIKLIVPFAPGGGSDIIARIIAPRLGDAVGQPVVIDNKPGTGTIIGAEIAAKAA